MSLSYVNKQHPEKMHIVKPQSLQNQSDHNGKELPHIEVLCLP
jgi:hypothetical protein